MWVVGTWVNTRLEPYIIGHAASEAALYMESFIEPKVQDLATAHDLSKESHAAIASMLEQDPIRIRVGSIKIWRPDGSIAHSADPSLVDRTFPAQDSLRKAIAGHVAAGAVDYSSPLHVHEQSLGRDLIEIFSPMHELGTNRVIAVAQIYYDGAEIRASVEAVHRQLWMVHGLVTVVVLFLLSVVVDKGSSVIDRLRKQYTAEIEAQARLIEKNRELQGRIAAAHVRSVEVNEQLLQRIGAELHDGPAQYLSYALLRLGEIDPRDEKTESDDAESVGRVTDSLQMVLTQALKELRNLSAGLSLPEIQALPADKAIALAVSSHERRTNTRVSCSIEPLPEDLPVTVKTCLYRFTQEGLNNAFRHAGGREQKVVARLEGETLLVQVSDGGPGFTSEALTAASAPEARLGLRGLRHRVESLGGSFEVHSSPGAGTSLFMSLNALNGVRGDD